jgi:hypothetical protein
MEKKCILCGVVKTLSDFNKKFKSTDGRQNKCRDCSKAYAKAHYEADKTYYVAKANKRRLRLVAEINEYKANKGCWHCSENEPCCLDLHHVGNKDFTVALSINRVSTDLIWKEIEKCEVLCANCHRKVHAGKLKSPR